MSLLSSPKQSAHFIGIAGSGMKVLARLMAGWGWKISGSDSLLTLETMQTFDNWKIKAYKGHDARFIPKNTDLVVYSAAVQEGNPERQQAARFKIKTYSYAEMLGQLSREFPTIAIAGTHGKTTTAAMTAAILEEAKLGTQAIFGGEVLNANNTPLQANHEHPLVLEACEYQKNFLNLAPQTAAILGVEPDHFDSYSQFEETENAFQKFASLIPKNGYLLIRGDDASAQKTKVATKGTCETFGQGKPNNYDWTIVETEMTPSGTACEIWHHNKPFLKMMLPTYGEHNLLNGLAACALAARHHVPPKIIKVAMEKFAGVQRRFEQRGKWREHNVTVIDDFAHHPTAIKLTLKTVRKLYPSKRIVCLFQPHQVSRTKALLEQFAKQLSLADSVLISPIFAAREKPGVASVSVAKQLIDQINLQANIAQFVPALDQIVPVLEDACHDGDVLVTMGAGDINKVANELTRRIQRNYAS